MACGERVMLNLGLNRKRALMGNPGLWLTWSRFRRSRKLEMVLPVFVRSANNMVGLKFLSRLLSDKNHSEHARQLNRNQGTAGVNQ